MAATICYFPFPLHSSLKWRQSLQRKQEAVRAASGLSAEKKRKSRLFSWLCRQLLDCFPLLIKQGCPRVSRNALAFPCLCLCVCRSVNPASQAGTKLKVKQVQPPEIFANPCIICLCVAAFSKNGRRREKRSFPCFHWGAMTWKWHHWHHYPKYTFVSGVPRPLPNEAHVLY